MTFKPTKTFSILLATIFLLAACAPVQATQSPQDIQNQISTAVAMTVQIQSLQTQAAQASQPTATLAFTPTEPVAVTSTPIFPTATPFEIIPTAVSHSGSSGGSSGGSSTVKYACDPDTGKRPRDNAQYKPGDSFDVKWTIINTGTATWPAGYDFSYFGGDQMTSAAGIQLPQMKPGDKYSVVFDAKAPASKGFHQMTWKVQGGFCYAYVAIIVQ